MASTPVIYPALAEGEVQALLEAVAELGQAYAARLEKRDRNALDEAVAKLEIAQRAWARRRGRPDPARRAS